MQVYLDNAATTAPFPEVVDVMLPFLGGKFGNPSSTHATGREARVAIESARKNIAGLLGISSSEIIFTSGGTEANNIFIQGFTDQHCHIISSKLEHPAIYKTLLYLENSKRATITWLKHETDGSISLSTLEEALAVKSKSLVVLMHGNNEIGNLLLLEEVSELCKKYKAPLFVDAVQTVGHYSLELERINLAGLSASAHKFHGPKGAGFLYLKQGTRLSNIYHGGGQERTLRPGTENVAAIVGMSKALEMCHERMNDDRKHIISLKKLLISELKDKIKKVEFNGTSEDSDNSIYTVLSVNLPPHPKNEVLLFELDLAGISVSAGSACASGAVTTSHVLEALDHDTNRGTLRFSFSRNNTVEEIKYVVNTIYEILN